MEHSIRQLNESEFPPLLREISDPPKQLFLRGVLPSTKSKLLCIVGSRRHSPYGKDVCETLIKELSGYDITIVSGLALGIDAIAHSSALKAGLGALAVPGSGLSDGVLYPRSHQQLAKEILDAGGGLLSEFEADFRATPYSFPQRNRIMAGMSHATLVIEAGEKSGTLITSRLATEYNRDVLAVPSSIFSKLSYGPHMLIRLGATPIRSGDDILEALHIEKVQKDITELKNLSEKETRVLDVLIHPRTKDDLLTTLNLPISEVNVLLSAMELKGLIIENLGEIRRVQ